MNNHTQSQEQQILAYLMEGRTLTALEALDKFQCFRLGARVFDLRKAGHNIESRPYRTPEGKTVAQYTLKNAA